MQMPEQVHNMQKPGGKVFGTIDVVITAGEGRKIPTGQSFMKEPMRMPDKNYPRMRHNGSMAADLQISRGQQHSDDLERQSPEPGSGLFGLNVDGDSHQESGLHLENHAPVSSSIWTEHQAGTPSSLELVKPNSHDQVPDDVRYPEENSEHQHLVTSSSPHQDVSQRSHTPQVHPSLCSSLSNTTRGLDISGYPSSHLALENAAPYTRPLDASHINGHGPNCPPPIPHVGGIGVELQQFGHNILPMLYWSPQESPLGFDHAQASFQGGNLLGTSDWSSRGVQDLTLISRSAQMAPSLLNHEIPRWPPLPTPSSGGRLVGPMPPVGLYSVPTKPNQRTASRKKLISSQLEKSTSVTFLRRLVILGKSKSVLVERQWDPPKRLEVSLTTPFSSEGQPNLPESMNLSPELIKHKDTSASIREPALTAVYSSASLHKEGAQPGFDPTRKALSYSAPVPSSEAPQHPICNEPSSKSSSRKRRKTDHHTPVDKPHSSLGSRAPQNPPLNQGCVIAYAESKDEDNEQGVARQIRSEKAGIFEEDYIIFATRFFVGER